MYFILLLCVFARQKFADFHKELDEKRQKQVKIDVEKWWKDFIFRRQDVSKDTEISETQFVDMLNGELKKDKAAFKKSIEDCFNTIFDVIDTNRDRSISEDEFLIAFKAYGHENVALDTKFFKAYNPDKDGLVPLNIIVQSWIDFVVSDDAKEKSLVKEAFEAGV